MSSNGHSTPAQIRAKLNHPVIDADGHWLEYGPVFSDQMRKVGGDKAAHRYVVQRNRIAAAEIDQREAALLAGQRLHLGKAVNSADTRQVDLVELSAVEVGNGVRTAAIGVDERVRTPAAGQRVVATSPIERVIAAIAA